MKTVHLKIKRQESPRHKPYWEEFRIPYRPNQNVVSALMYIQKNPVNLKGEQTTPVVWESNCLEEVCGACTMIINGKARQACTALLDSLQQPIVLEPLSKFPLVKDLMVDREALFAALRKVKAWVEIDGTYDLGPGLRQFDSLQEFRYKLSRCMTCGVCAEVCPNFNSKTDFLGPAAVGQAHLFNLHPVGQNGKKDRLRALMGPGGIMECGNAQNCVQACPKGLPLTTSLAELKKQVAWQAAKSLFIE